MSINSDRFREKLEYSEIYVWGSNKFGQIGLTSKKSGKSYCIPRFCSFNIVVINVSCGQFHSALVTNKGLIYTLGSNAEGALGIGQKEPLYSAAPVLVEALCNNRAVKVACGGGHSMAILENGSVYSWGLGGDGQLGLSSRNSHYAPDKIKLLDESAKFIDVICGHNHSFVISDSFDVYCFGSNTYGQLGTGSRESILLPSKLTTLSKRIFRIAAGHHFTLMLSDQGTLFVTGDNSSGQLGLPRNKSTVLLPTPFPFLESALIVRISAGRHAGAITDKGELYIWGPTTYGKFYEPILISANGAEKISDLQMGGNFGLAVGRSGELYSWGNNVSGELGVGDFSERKTGIYPINFLKDKRVMTFACGENHIVAIGEVCTNDKDSLRASTRMSEDEGLLNEQFNFFKKEEEREKRLSNSAVLDLNMINEAEKVQTPLRDFKVKKHYVNSACETKDGKRPENLAVADPKNNDENDDIEEMNKMIKKLMASGDSYAYPNQIAAQRQLTNQDSILREIRSNKSSASSLLKQNLNNQGDSNHNEFDAMESSFKVSDTEELDGNSGLGSEKKSEQSEEYVALRKLDGNRSTGSMKKKTLEHEGRRGKENSSALQRRHDNINFDSKTVKLEREFLEKKNKLLEDKFGEMKVMIQIASDRSALESKGIIEQIRKGREGLSSALAPQKLEEKLKSMIVKLQEKDNIIASLQLELSKKEALEQAFRIKIEALENSLQIKSDELSLIKKSALLVD